mgnify:CR=1 FL=1|jgi:hypothetical protein
MKNQTTSNPDSLDSSTIDELENRWVPEETVDTYLTNDTIQGDGVEDAVTELMPCVQDTISEVQTQRLNSIDSSGEHNTITSATGQLKAQKPSEGTLDDRFFDGPDSNMTTQRFEAKSVTNGGGQSPNPVPLYEESTKSAGRLGPWLFGGLAVLAAAAMGIQVASLYLSNSNTEPVAPQPAPAIVEVLNPYMERAQALADWADNDDSMKGLCEIADSYVLSTQPESKQVVAINGSKGFLLGMIGKEGIDLLGEDNASHVMNTFSEMVAYNDKNEFFGWRATGCDNYEVKQ